MTGRLARRLRIKRVLVRAQERQRNAATRKRAVADGLSFRGQAEFKSQGNSLIVIARGDCFHRLTWPDAPSSGS